MHAKEQLRTASPAPMTLEDEGEKEFDDQATKFDGSAPASRFSTLGGKFGGVWKHRNFKRPEDAENAHVPLSCDIAFSNVDRQSTVIFFVF